MVPKSSRVNLKKDFKWVASGYKKETSSMRLMYRLGDNSHPKVGVAISARYFKKSHERNAAKRKVFKSLSVILPILSKNLNLVIMPKSIVLEKEIESLTEELKNVTNLYQNN